MVFRFFIEGRVEGVGGWFCNPQLLNQGRIQGGAHPVRSPLKLDNMIFLRKMVIFHTKYPKNFRASLRSVQFFTVRPPLTWNSGSAPGTPIYVNYVSNIKLYFRKTKRTPRKL